MKRKLYLYAAVQICLMLGTSRPQQDVQPQQKETLMTKKAAESSKATGNPPAREIDPKIKENTSAEPTNAARKPNLDQEKQQLELKKLRNEVWTGSITFEIIKAVGSFAALAGIIVTLYLGLRNQRDAQTSRDDERFDSAVARLGGTQASERLTGLAGLEQALRRPGDRQESALRYLINATVIEQDPTVRSALLDVFNELRDYNLDTAVLNASLAAARDRNRAVYKRLCDKFWAEKMNKGPLPVSDRYTEVPMGDPSPEERAPLEASASVIAALIRAGASVTELSNIYCVDCTLSSCKSPARLEGANFDGAILRRADFTRAELASASFHITDLINASFLHADLRGAKLTAQPASTGWNILGATFNGNIGSSFYGTNFACSDLSNSDFTGRPIFALIYNNPVFGGSMRDEFYGANLSGANFTRSLYIVGVPEEAVRSPAGSGIPLLPQNLTPWPYSQATGPGDPIKYYMFGKYRLWTANWGGADLPQVAFPQGYWQDARVALASMSAAKNLDQAQLPFALKKWITANADAVSKPISTYDCSAE